MFPGFLASPIYALTLSIFRKRQLWGKTGLQKTGQKEQQRYKFGQCTNIRSSKAESRIRLKMVCLWKREDTFESLGDVDMAECKKMNMAAVRRCVEIYISAYGEAPWNEKYREEDVRRYLMDFLDSDTKCAYVLAQGEDILGVALGLVVPCIGSHYFRLEDICIDPKYQRAGCGRELIRLMTDSLRRKDCDSMLLGTQRGYPSHKFYLQCGFREIDSVLLYREMKQEQIQEDAI